MISGSFPHTMTAFQHHIYKPPISLCHQDKLLTGFLDPDVREIEIHKMYGDMRRQWFLPVMTVLGWSYDIAKSNPAVDGCYEALFGYEAGSESYMTAIVLPMVSYQQ
ncbi:hypothetical protein G7Z17_g9036 [Cylindrodendrum hubeiense]|uniref:Uncharacterized protein n=1 Tax=Cylindrodendrum hubeiense TaxID=595255 RepID=A0A9P5H5V4_9HYPO|nr:hypothetical protein G7Z17_g9036 [Cylindrodendrum hubeiense]